MTTTIQLNDAATTIRARSSKRSYDGRPLEEADAAHLRAAIAAAPTAPFNTPVRLALLDHHDAEQDGKIRLGTYGVIRGARSFLVGAVADGEHALEDFGYVFEWLLLMATARGLGSCWLGGTFRRSAFSAAVGCSGDELVPAISPVGHATDRRSLIDATFRLVAGSKKRKPWEQLFFSAAGLRPLRSDQAGVLSEPIEALRLAPSASNNQPWRLVVNADSGSCALHLHRTPGYHQRFTADLQRVDMGIAMCHLALVAQQRGIAGRWHATLPADWPSPDGCSAVACWRPD